MNREILFRGKRVNNGEWVYGYLTICTDGSCYIKTEIERNVLRYVKGKPSYVFNCIEYEVDPKTVGQYTGIKIGGQKLFEHDVVRYRETGSDDWQYGVVVWCGDRDYPAFDVEPWIDCDCNGLSYIVTVCEAEIIGNKWDNPELLEALGDE